MSKIAFIFPGQGAQTTGMGQDFYQETETGPIFALIRRRRTV